MGRAVTENCTGTVLRGCGVVMRGQLLDFKLGQVIAVDGPTRDALDAGEAPIAWDGEVPPASSTLAANDLGLPPGMY